MGYCARSFDLFPYASEQFRGWKIDWVTEQVNEITSGWINEIMSQQ